MINLPTEEAVVFDCLSILNIKLNKVPSEQNISNFQQIAENIRFQIGNSLYTKIINSLEYYNLFQINKQIFELIDEFRKGKTTNYKQADDLNLLRFQYKQQLQKMFFNSELKETKIVY